MLRDVFSQPGTQHIGGRLLETRFCNRPNQNLKKKNKKIQTSVSLIPPLPFTFKLAIKVDLLETSEL